VEISFLYGREPVSLSLPDDAIVYESHFPDRHLPADRIVQDALADPFGAAPLTEALSNRREGNVVVVVSDVTRPIPYHAFLPQMLEVVEAGGIPREHILILIGTGMHRPSTADERVEMFGPDVLQRYRIVDHRADDADSLATLPGKSWSGSPVRLNRHYVHAGFRIITGLVEPHFMAGFSGGRKAVCPGLTSLDSVARFHGHEFMADPRACNGNLVGNPCHDEALSIARMAGVDFSLNVVLNKDRETVAAFAGELESAHAAACEFVRECACPQVREQADVVITSCGGYPLDATFYQCVKGMVSCLPAVKKGGTVVSFGGCSEGVGSPEYVETMYKYAGRWPDFLRDIRMSGTFVKDQWQFQMQCRALDKVGEDNLIFVTDGLDQRQLDKLSVNGQAAGRRTLNEVLNSILQSELHHSKRVAVLSEGPYCAPV